MNPQGLIRPLADEAWDCLRPTLADDIEDTQQIRRYIALRWTRPRPRKLRNADLEIDETGAVSSPWVRPGRNLTGWATFDWQRAHGSIYISAVVPWTTVEPFDPAALVLTEALRRVHQERTAELASRPADPPASGDLPPIKHVWCACAAPIEADLRCRTMMYHDPAHRAVTYMTKKRGFLLLNDYLAAYPDTPRDIFPPHRTISRSAQQQTGWLVLVKRIDARYRSIIESGSAIAARPVRSKRGRTKSVNLIPVEV